MNGSRDRYKTSYGTTGSFIEQGDASDERESRPRFRKPINWRDVLSVVILAVIVVSFCTVFGYAVVLCLIGSGRP